MIGATAASDEVVTTQTVARGLQVLRAFRAESAPLGNADLVRRTALSKATVSRITTTLLGLGYVTRTPGSRKFQLGTRALSLGHAYVETSPVMPAVRSHLQALADRLDVSVALAVGDGLDMLYLAYCKSAKIATLHFGVGSVLPMATTAIGRAWVWSLPPTERQARVKALLTQAGGEAVTVRKRLTAAFTELDRFGFCLSLGEYQRDAFGLAVPVTVGVHATPMALACGAAALGLEPEKLRGKLGPEVRRAARELTRILADIDCTP